MARLEAHGLWFEIALDGPPEAPVVVLCHGVGMQLTAWPEDLLRALHEAGYRTLRFDARDCGRSSWMAIAGRPNLWLALLRQSLGLAVYAPYRLADFADDVLAMVQALGLKTWHLVGFSMGGMVAQHVAARRPSGLKSLSLLMTSSGAKHLSRPAWSVLAVVFGGLPAQHQHQALIAHQIRLLRCIGSPINSLQAPHEAAKEARRISCEAAAAVQRGANPDGWCRHSLAVLVDGDRSPLLAAIDVPCLVLHGQADRLIAPAAAHDLAHKVAAAQLVLLEGLGHDLAPPWVPDISRCLCDHLRHVP